MVNLKTLRVTYRTDARNVSQDADARCVALCFRLIGQSMNAQTTLRHVRRSANGTVIE
jgi:hypothetical protein